MRYFHGYDAERIVQALDREIRGRGHGSIKAVNRALDRTEGWWQHRAATGDIPISQLLEVLDHLGLDAVEFIRRALGAEDELGLDRPRGEAPEIVVKAWERFETGEEGKLGRPFLDALDEQRYRDPEKTAGLAGWGVGEIEIELLPRLLGVLGSAWWLMLQLEEAEHAILAGIEMAELRADRAAISHLLCRLSYVVADRGDRRAALQIAEKAGMMHLRRGDREGLGRALVAQGIWLYYLDRPEEAIQSWNMALDQLPREPSRNRFSAFQCLGFAHQRLGNLDAAMENVDAAHQLLPTDNEWARAKLLWLRGRIQADRDQLLEAVGIFESVVSIFRDLHHGETALATCELVRLRLAQGQYAAAYESAISTRSLLEPLRHNRIISAAIGDLLRSGQAGLTLALVERVMARIESERQKSRIWRSLQIQSSDNQPPGSKSGPIFGWTASVEPPGSKAGPIFGWIDSTKPPGS